MWPYLARTGQVILLLRVSVTESAEDPEFPPGSALVIRSATPGFPPQVRLNPRG
jgi:hypothetical protein